MLAHFQRHWKWLIVTGASFLVLALFFFFGSSGTAHEVLRWASLAAMAFFGAKVIHIFESELKR